MWGTKEQEDFEIKAVWQLQDSKKKFPSNNLLLAVDAGGTQLAMFFDGLYSYDDLENKGPGLG